MRILLGMIIVLSFPVLEVYTLVQIYHYIGAWVIALLAGGVLAGWSLITGERLAYHHDPAIGRLAIARGD